MKPLLIEHLESMKSHLHQLMEREYQQHGEFLLASIVQDALSYGFVSYLGVPESADDISEEEIMEIAYFSSKSVVEYSLIHFSLNQAVVKESIRGTMLAVDGLGKKTDLLATSVFLGAAEELLRFGESCYTQCMDSVLSAISRFYVDSGRTSSAVNIEILLKHMAKHIPDLTRLSRPASRDSAVGEG